MTKTKKKPSVNTPIVGAPGADSSAEVTTTIYGKNFVGSCSRPVWGFAAFLGTVFQNAGASGWDTVQSKNGACSACYCWCARRPLARQTGRIHGSEGDGTVDAKGNVLAILGAFGIQYLAQQGGEFYVYLDDEGAPSPTLSAEYWTGWSETLVSYSKQLSSDAVTLLPGLYCNFDKASWQALERAVAQGAECYSAWVARWKSDGQVCMPLPPWNRAHVTPDPAPVCPIHIWQYAKECHGGDGFDTDEANPQLPQEDLLIKLILPPS